MGAGRVNGLAPIIQAQNTPAVCVVVYGNRVYEDALIELSDILAQCGCETIAGGAWIGGYSFSRPGTPTAEGRPDARDRDRAELFGQKIREKINAVSSPGRHPGVTLPGCHPYCGDSKLLTVDFIAVSDECVQCGICAEGCPIGAIDPHNAEPGDRYEHMHHVLHLHPGLSPSRKDHETRSGHGRFGAFEYPVQRAKGARIFPMTFPMTRDTRNQKISGVTMEENDQTLLPPG